MRQDFRRGRGRAAAVQASNWAGWWLAGLLGAGMLWAGAALGQVAPEVVRPGSGGAVVPPAAGDGGAAPAPRSENPLVDGRARPVPDNGIIVPPARESPMVVRPPAAGTMPIIPPPGSSGGDRTVVPK